MSFFSNPNRIPESYGLRITAGLIGFFLIMKLVGLSHIVELRLLNLFILSGGVYAALNRFRQTHDELNYFRGLITGVTAASIGSVVFAFFLFLYMKFDTEMMQFIIENEPMGRYMNPYIASFIVALEGVFSGILVTFILMNYFGAEKSEVSKSDVEGKV